MIAVLGFATIIIFLYVTMTKKIVNSVGTDWHTCYCSNNWRFWF